MTVYDHYMRRYDVTLKRWVSYKLHAGLHDLGVFGWGRSVLTVQREGDGEVATRSTSGGGGTSKRILTFNGEEHVPYERYHGKEDEQMAVGLILVVITLLVIVYFNH